MIDTIIDWTKRIFFICIGAWLVWLGITHAAQVANIFVTVLDAVKIFFTTLANGVLH
jgi:hypothetical protein